MHNGTGLNSGQPFSKWRLELKNDAPVNSDGTNWMKI